MKLLVGVGGVFFRRTVFSKAGISMNGRFTLRRNKYRKF